MLRQVAPSRRDAVPAEPEGLLIPLCPECGSYYIDPIEDERFYFHLWRSLGEMGLEGEQGTFYVCLPCGWIGNRPHFGI